MPPLSQLDVSFFHGGLEVHYPEISISKCLAIPEVFREKISTVWTAPQIRFLCADKMERKKCSCKREGYMPQCVNCKHGASSHFVAIRASWTSQTLQMKRYALVMVDPDAPSRYNPSRAHWRHWLLVDVKGDELRNGELDGKIISEYARPTPPPKSGFHRYQFMLFQQPAGALLSLTEEESSSLGNWDLWMFISRFDLELVAAAQFLTQNYKD